MSSQNDEIAQLKATLAALQLDMQVNKQSAITFNMMLQKLQSEVSIAKQPQSNNMISAQLSLLQNDVKLCKQSRLDINSVSIIQDLNKKHQELTMQVKMMQMDNLKNKASPNLQDLTSKYSDIVLTVKNLENHLNVSNSSSSYLLQPRVADTVQTLDDKYTKLSDQLAQIQEEIVSLNNISDLLIQNKTETSKNLSELNSKYYDIALQINNSKVQIYPQPVMNLTDNTSDILDLQNKYNDIVNTIKNINTNPTTNDLQKLSNDINGKLDQLYNQLNTIQNKSNPNNMEEVLLRISRIEQMLNIV